ncbi:MAG: anthranilate synthase component II [Flavobacteriaceae bacterium]
MSQNKPIFVVDNFDSFVFNLVHYIEELGHPVVVKRNNAFELQEVEAYDKILLSPGPGIPDEAGRMKALIQEYWERKNILGVCLGHQAIAEVFGGQLENLSQVYHGIATPAHQLQSDVIWTDIPETFEVGRYHSWVVQKNLPESLVPLAIDDQHRLMAFRHSEKPIWGMQYHPESVLTPHGKKMIANWLNT